jgi:hypothetical protein
VTRGRKVLLTFVAVVLGAVAIYKLIYPTVEWHQKLTVSVDVEGQVVSGSSVVAIIATKMPNLFFHDMRWDVRGEATVVQLPDGRYLFALLKNAIVLADNVFPEVAQREPIDAIKQARLFKSQSGVRDVPPVSYPLLVTFTDIKDPKTVREVDPDNLAATFGPGVSLKRITLEITDETVTAGEVRKVLAWLATVGDGMLDGSRISSLSAGNRLANDLSRLNFERN